MTNVKAKINLTDFAACESSRGKQVGAACEQLWSVQGLFQVKGDCYRCLISGDARWFVIIILPFAVLAALLGTLYLVQHSRSPFVQQHFQIAAPGFAAIAVLLGLLALISDWPYPYTPLRIAAGPFAWPRGCPARVYGPDDIVPLACHDPKNAIPTELVAKHGFFTRVRSPETYYRVGNDAVYFVCNYWNRTCQVDRVERNVFVVS